MDEPEDIILSETRQAWKHTNAMWFHYMRYIKVVKFRDGKSNGGYQWSYYWERVSVCEDTKVLWMAEGDGCTTVWIHLIPLSCTLKNSSDGQLLIMFILPNKKFLWTFLQQAFITTQMCFLGQLRYQQSLICGSKIRGLESVAPGSSWKGEAPSKVCEMIVCEKEKIKCFLGEGPSFLL